MRLVGSSVNCCYPAGCRRARCRPADPAVGRPSGRARRRNARRRATATARRAAAAGFRAPAPAAKPSGRGRHAQAIEHVVRDQANTGGGRVVEVRRRAEAVRQAGPGEAGMHGGQPAGLVVPDRQRPAAAVQQAGAQRVDTLGTPGAAAGVKAESQTFRGPRTATRLSRFAPLMAEHGMSAADVADIPQSPQER